MPCSVIGGHAHRESVLLVEREGVRDLGAKAGLVNVSAHAPVPAITVQATTDVRHERNVRESSR